MQSPADARVLDEEWYSQSGRSEFRCRHVADVAVVFSMCSGTGAGIGETSVVGG